MSDPILDQLSIILQERKTSEPDQSYVAWLYDQGLDTILKKIGEESAEVIIAGKSHDAEALVHEIADLWFHSLVLLVDQGLDASAITQELERRFGQSGLTEKSNRK